MQVGDQGEEEGEEENRNATNSTSLEDLQARRFDLVHVFGYATMHRHSCEKQLNEVSWRPRRLAIC
jgi:hypothetical protein